MTALPPAPGVARIRISGVWAGGMSGGCRVFVTNGSDSGYTNADVTAIGTAVAASSGSSFLKRWAPHQSTSWTWTEVDVVDLTSDTAPTFTTTAAVNGTESTYGLPPQCAVGISWGIARRYRGGHPRMYLPAITGAAVGTAATSLLAEDVATAIQTAAIEWLGDLGGISGLSHDILACNVSYFSGNSVRITPQVDVIVDALVHRRIDSQRRRSGKESSFGVA